MFLIDIRPTKCDKAFGNYASTLKFVRKCYKTQKMCNKAANTYLSTI